MRLVRDLIIGTAAEQPPADNPHGGVSDTAEHPTYLAWDTGDFSESTGKNWAPVASIGAIVPDASTTTAGKVLTYALATTAIDYSALLTESWIVVTAANKTITLPDAATVPAAHPGFTVKVFGGSNCTVQPPQLAVPATPVPTSPHTGGTVADGAYIVKVTYTNSLPGETLPSPAGTVTATGAVADTSTLVIPSPIAEAGATGWNAYVTDSGGSTLFLQNVAPTPIGTDLTLTAPPSSITAQPPVSSTASVCLIDGGVVFSGLAVDKGAATFKSNGTDYLVS